MAFYPRVRARKNSAGSVFTRERVNFIEGTNITLTLADDGSEIDLTIATSVAAGHTIQENSVSLTQRANLNFQDGIVATDDAGNDQTDINIDYGLVGDITQIDIGDAAAAGTDVQVARSDHQHALPAPTAGYPVDVAATEADGTATTVARADHRHAHGTSYRGAHVFGMKSIVFADSPYTVLSTEDVVLADATGGAITVVLPTAVGATGRVITVKKIDSSANAVTIDGNGAETIDDATTQVLSAQYDSMDAVSDNVEWWVL